MSTVCYERPIWYFYEAIIDGDIMCHPDMTFKVDWLLYAAYFLQGYKF